MKAFLLAASAALMMTACHTTADDDYMPADAAPPAMSAATYMQTAASSDMFEIQSGQLALQRSCDPAVRSFAQMIINDHTRMSNMMMDTGRANGLPPPPVQMLPHHMNMLQTLDRAPPGSFEAAFRNEQVMAHQEALNLHRSYADAGDLPPFRALASQAVPAIQAHLGHAQSLPTSAACVTAPTEQLRRGERG
ncbi:MAG TPA: DUF4142 domain-containing protein [Allosphingosinicella sp.]|jgi:putative membrane protein